MYFFESDSNASTIEIMKLAESGLASIIEIKAVALVPTEIASKSAEDVLNFLKAETTHKKSNVKNNLTTQLSLEELE